MSDVSRYTKEHNPKTGAGKTLNPRLGAPLVPNREQHGTTEFANQVNSCYSADKKGRRRRSVASQLPTSAFVGSNRGQHGILAQNNGAPCAAFLDLRWNRPEGANRMIKFFRRPLNSRAHLD